MPNRPDPVPPLGIVCPWLSEDLLSSFMTWDNNAESAAILWGFSELMGSCFQHTCFSSLNPSITLKIKKNPIPQVYNQSYGCESVQDEGWKR